MMKKWVDYVRSFGPEEYLWLGGYHYGDWLAMDAGSDSYLGATSNDLIASAFFAHSADIVVKAGEVLGKNVDEYRELHRKIVAAFREYFMENGMPKEEFPFTETNPTPWQKREVVDTVRRGVTQTALVLILHFGLCLPNERQALADKLEELIYDFDCAMSTGFLGTPYILHVLSSCGKTDLAYKLLFRDKNPSWLYSVDHGATTMWEHWNGIKEDGSFWSADMNSFNHYAYGAVGDLLYGVVAGIGVSEDGAGYKKIVLAPHPDPQLAYVNCSIETVCGRVESNWYCIDGNVRFEFVVPEGSEATVMLPDAHVETVCGGRYTFFCRISDCE